MGEGAQGRNVDSNQSTTEYGYWNCIIIKTLYFPSGSLSYKYNGRRGDNRLLAAVIIKYTNLA